MVTTGWPSHAAASVRHDRTRWPSTMTVQAPHAPWSHPFLVPVRPSTSRRASSKVTRESSESSWSLSLTRVLVITSRHSRLGVQRSRSYGLSKLRRSRSRAPCVDNLDSLGERVSQDAFAEKAEHEPKQPSPDVLAVANHDGVQVGLSVGPTRKSVDVAGTTAPEVGVGCRHDDTVGIGPVVVQAFPDAARALGDVRFFGALTMHLEVLVGTVAKELRAARTEAGYPGAELLGCGG